MAENTKKPPPDPRQRTSQGDPARPQKPGGNPPGQSGGRQGVADPSKRPDSGLGIDDGRDRPEIGSPGKPSRIDQDRDRQGVGRKSPDSGKDDGKDGVVDLDDIDTDEQATQRLDRA